MSTNTQRIFVFEDKRYLIVDMHFEYVQRAESYSGRPSTRPLHSNILLYLRPLGKYKEQALIMQYALKRDISGHIEFLITDNGLENKIMSDLEFANAKIKRIGISSQHPGFEGQDILRVEIKPYIVKFQDEITELPTNPSNPFIASNIPITTPDKEEAPALVTAVSGPKTLTIGQQAQFTVTEWNGQTQKADLQRIRWAIQVEGEVQRIKPQGKVLKYTPKAEHQGKEIIVMPYLQQYTPEVSVKAVVLGDLEIDIDESGKIEVKGSKDSTQVTYYHKNTQGKEELGTWEIIRLGKQEEKTVDTNNDGVPDAVYIPIADAAQVLAEGKGKSPTLAEATDLTPTDLEQLHIALHRFEEEGTASIPIEKKTIAIETPTAPIIAGEKLNETTYRIGTGDTFSELEQQYNLPNGILSQLNPTIDPTTLQIGQKIAFATRYKQGNRYLTIVGDEAPIQEGTIEAKEIKDPKQSDVFEDIQNKRAQDLKKVYDQGAKSFEKGGTADFWLNKGVPVPIAGALFACVGGAAGQAARKLIAKQTLPVMLTKGAISMGSDMVLNKGEFNAVGVGADMVLIPVVTDLVGAAWEVKVNLIKREVTTDNFFTGNKSLQDFGAEVAGGIIFGAKANFLSGAASEGMTKAGKKVIESSAEVVEKSVVDLTKKEMKDHDKEK